MKKFISAIFLNTQEDTVIDIVPHTEIIQNFLNSIENQDFETIINLFDWDVIEFDYKQFSALMISIFPLSASNEFPGIDYYSKITRKADNIREIETFISNLLLPEKYYNFLEGRRYPWPTSSSETFTEDIIIEFLGFLDFRRLADLEIIEI